MAYGDILPYFTGKQKGNKVIIKYIEGTEVGGVGRTDKVFYFSTKCTDEARILKNCLLLFGDGGYGDDEKAFFAGTALRPTYPDEKPYQAGLNYKFVIREPNYD